MYYLAVPPQPLTAAEEELDDPLRTDQIDRSRPVRGVKHCHHRPHCKHSEKPMSVFLPRCLRHL